jgi:hypothetical protein
MTERLDEEFDLVPQFVKRFALAWGSHGGSLLFGVRQLAAAFLQDSLLAVHQIVALGLLKREQARRRKVAASCRTPKPS